jgi:hypothetical protein
MTTINEEFNKEFNILAEKGNTYWIELFEIQEQISSIPAVSNLKICKQLENVYQEAYIRAMKVAEISLKLSSLYRDIYIVSNIIYQVEKDK